MTIPQRLHPERPDDAEVREFCRLCDEIEDGLSSRRDVSAALARWNARAHRRFEPHEFTSYAGAVDQETFVIDALRPLPGVIGDLRYSEALAVVGCVVEASLPEADLSYFLEWLSVQFPSADVSELIYSPGRWFRDGAADAHAFSPAQTLEAAMQRSRRRLADGPSVPLPFPVPARAASLVTPAPGE